MKLSALIFVSLWNLVIPQNVFKPPPPPAPGRSAASPPASRLNLNPYMLQYLKQLLARSDLNLSWQRNPTAPNQMKLKAMSLNPRLQPGNTKTQSMNVNPHLVKALYGSTFIRPSAGSPDSGKYAFAQVKSNAAQQNQLANKYPTVATGSSPNLGNMLYQYAKRQHVTQKQSPVPAMNQNLYKMFGRMTYGPMPKPSSVSYGAPSQGYQPPARVMTSPFRSPVHHQQAFRPPQSPRSQSYPPVSQSGFTARKPVSFQSPHQPQQSPGAFSNDINSYASQRKSQQQLRVAV